MPDPVKDYLATIGKKGGEAGTGTAKRRSREQYQAMAAKSALVRKKRTTDSAAETQEKRR